MKVLLIVPYFGKSPGWTDYFIKSCTCNLNVSWLFYGNLNINCKAANNIYVEKTQINDFNKLATAKLDIPVNILNPYKICDFRPAFGEIFSDYINEYDFWGYCDLDMIFGTISNFILLNDLETYDIITTGQDYLAGHFTIYRNNDKIRQLYKSVWHIEKKLRDSYRHYYLDEKSNYIGQQLINNGKSRFWLYSKIIKRGINSIRYRFLKVLPFKYDMTKVLINEEKKGNIKILRIKDIKSDDYYIDRSINSWSVEWRNGSLIDLRDNAELMYFHFIKSKRQEKFRIAPFRDQARFKISKYGIQS